MPKKTDATAEKPKPSADGEKAKKLLARIRQRVKIMTEADEESNRKPAMEDLKFIHEPGAQWDQTFKNERGNRPCYEFNKLAIKIARIVNDMRANRPAGKVRGTEDSDKPTAEIYEGLGRNILSVSDADTVFDYAGEYQVAAGMGAWRVETKYADDSFDQDICVSAIKNPFCLYADPACTDPLKRDAEDWFLSDRIANKLYEEKYGDVPKIDFDDMTVEDDEDWKDSETTRIGEYWYKERYEKELWLLKDGRVVDSTAPEAEQLKSLIATDAAGRPRTRKVKCPRIMMVIVSGNAILEGPKEWAGTQFPFVIVYGKWIVINGKVRWYGLTRHAKDAQREYNVSRTAISETIAQSPQSKYWATAKQAKGHSDKWQVAHKENLPFLLYNPDPEAGNQPPQLMPGVQIPAALMQEAAMADQDLKDVTGVYDPTLGAKSNETSGRAISRRAEQSELVTFHFQDNMAKGIKRTWEILIDLIPHVYDTERSIRILGADGAEKFEKVNQSVVDPTTGTQKVVNDLRRGKYDVAITTGPSFTTQRQEASELYMQLGQAFPPLMQIAGDLVFKSMDLPYAEQIAERLRTLLPPQIQQSIAEGKPIPPEVQAVMAQAQQAMAVVQELSARVQAAAQEVQTEKADAEKAKAEVQTAIANLKTEEARFQALVAQKTAEIATREAQSAQKGAEAGVANDRESLANEVQQALVAIQQAAAQFMQQAMQTLAEMQARTQPQVIVANPPKRKQVRVRRENGELIGEVNEIPELVQ